MTEAPPDELASTPPRHRGLKVLSAVLLTATVAFACVGAIALHDERSAHRDAESARATAASEHAARVQSDQAAAKATADAAEARSEEKDEETNNINASNQVVGAFDSFKQCLRDLEDAFAHSSPADVDHLDSCQATYAALGGNVTPVP